jgi:hypothetical protein
MLNAKISHLKGQVLLPTCPRSSSTDEDSIRLSDQDTETLPIARQSMHQIVWLEADMYWLINQYIRWMVWLLKVFLDNLSSLFQISQQNLLPQHSTCVAPMCIFKLRAELPNRCPVIVTSRSPTAGSWTVHEKWWGIVTVERKWIQNKKVCERG